MRAFFSDANRARLEAFLDGRGYSTHDLPARMRRAVSDAAIQRATDHAHPTVADLNAHVLHLYQQVGGTTGTVVHGIVGGDRAAAQ